MIEGLTGTFGKELTLRVFKNKRTFNTRGDYDDTDSDNYDDRTITAIVQVMGADDMTVQEGLLQTGDLMIFADASETYANSLTNNNRVLFASKWYVIKNSIMEQLHTETTDFYEVHCKKI